MVNAIFDKISLKIETMAFSMDQQHKLIYFNILILMYK